MTNKEIREWYLSELERIPTLNEEWKKQGLSARKRAKRAFSFRNRTRQKARAKMKRFYVTLLRAADRVRYGSQGRPTFDALVKRLRDNGLTDDQAFEAIIEKAGQTNPRVNRWFGFLED